MNLLFSFPCNADRSSVHVAGCMGQEGVVYAVTSLPLSDHTGASLDGSLKSFCLTGYMNNLLLTVTLPLTLFFEVQVNSSDSVPRQAL